MRPILARQMENYAGFLEHVDHHVGRLVDALDEIGVLDDTLVYYIIGDNGASAEGTLQGTFNEMISLNGMGELETPEFLRSRLDQLGGPSPPALCGGLGARDVHAVPVDQAGRVALGRHAQRHDRALAERHQGERRDPQPVPPRHRRRPHRAGAAALPEPTFVNGVARSRCTASSMLYSFDDAKAPSGTRRSTSRSSATAASTTRAGRR
jgi:arylsulfatase